MTDRYDAVISRKDKNDKWRSTKIGAGFPKGDRINIVLDALPMPNAEGQAWITLFPAKDKTQPMPSVGINGEPVKDELSDEVPF